MSWSPSRTPATEHFKVEEDVSTSAWPPSRAPATEHVKVEEDASTSAWPPSRTALATEHVKVEKDASTSAWPPSRAPAGERFKIRTKGASAYTWPPQSRAPPKASRTLIPRALGSIEECIPIPPRWPENRLPEEEEWEQVCLRCGELKHRAHANWHSCRKTCWICRTDRHMHKHCNFNDHIKRLQRAYGKTSKSEIYFQKHLEVQQSKKAENELREKARRDQGDYSVNPRPLVTTGFPELRQSSNVQRLSQTAVDQFTTRRIVQSLALQSQAPSQVAQRSSIVQSSDLQLQAPSQVAQRSGIVQSSTSQSQSSSQAAVSDTVEISRAEYEYLRKKDRNFEALEYPMREYIYPFPT